MLTKKQYKFLKDFIKIAKKSKESDKQLKYFNREERYGICFDRGGVFAVIVFIILGTLGIAFSNKPF